MILSRTATGKVLMLEGILTKESKAMLASLPKPKSVLGKDVPDNLNGITLGELFDLQSAVESQDMHKMVDEFARVLLGVPSGKMWRLRADYGIGFVMWAMRELEQIAKMWKSITPPPSPESVQAGVDRLNFGNFGVVDWFALRMGISDHDKVLQLPWVRVFECMRIDNERATFQERLRDIMTKNIKKR